MPKKRPDLLGDINFRQLVKACATDQEIVALFNAMHGLNLQCPIKPLVEPIFPLDLSEEELLHMAWFVAWVQHNHWNRLRAAAANLHKLRRLYSSKRALSASRPATRRVH